MVDQKCAGLRTTDVIADLTRAVPIFATTEEALGEFPAIRTAVVGISTPGGRLTDSLRRTLLDCAERSLDLVSGLHDFLADDPAIAPAAAASGAVITDVRRTLNARCCIPGTAASSTSARPAWPFSVWTASSASARRPNC